MQLHDRSDVTIPWQGGASSDGWIYETLNRTVGVWSAVHGCGPAAYVQTDFSGGGKHLECHEYSQCNTGIVMYCMYDGHHGDWPDKPRAGDLIWSFFLNATNATTSFS